MSIEFPSTEREKVVDKTSLESGKWHMPISPGLVGLKSLRHEDLHEFKSRMNNRTRHYQKKKKKKQVWRRKLVIDIIVTM